jgi:hypothetical protein
MRNEHLSEAAMQRYVQECLEDLKGEPKAAFDFDLSRLVLAQLPRKRSVFSPYAVFVYFLGLSVCSAIAVPVYLFGKDLLRLFRSDLVRLFAGILPMAIGLILITALTIFLFQLVELYRKYRAQMKALNY